MKSPRTRQVVKNLPGEMMHRAASVIIIVEGVQYIFHSLKLVVVGGIIFLVTEVVSMAFVETEVDESQRGW
jgi:hypothetical protein